MATLKPFIDLPEVIIIDDFYPNLDWLFPYLASQSAHKNQAVNYAGVVYPAPPQTNYALQKILQEFNVQSSTTSGQGEIRLTTLNDRDQVQTLVHTDEGFNVIIYLSGKEEEGLGTNFYRHKELGLASSDENVPLQKKMTILFDHDTKNLDRWEVTHQVSFKKNRAVFFNGRYFHSVPLEFYGADKTDGRLTQNFFFSNKKQG